MGRIVNRSECAEAFGVALTTIDQWISAGMPYAARPERKGGSTWQIDLAAVLEWHRSRERRNAIGEIAAIDEGEARRRKLAAEAASAEFDLAKKQDAAVAVVDFEAAWSQMIGAARSRLLGVGAKLARSVSGADDPAECQALIQDAVNEALAELSEFAAVLQIDAGCTEESGSGDEAAVAAVGASSGPDRKRVGGRRAKTEPGVKR